MDSLKLDVPKPELVQALRVLGTNRRRRFSGVVPIWLSYVDGALRLTEERGGVMAGVAAVGAWPAAGATVNLFALRRAAEASKAEIVEIIVAENAILVPTTRGYVSLDLLRFGPDNPIQPLPPRPDRHSDLPLFIWADRRAL